MIRKLFIQILWNILYVSEAVWFLQNSFIVGWVERFEDVYIFFFAKLMCCANAPVMLFVELSPCV